MSEDETQEGNPEESAANRRAATEIAGAIRRGWISGVEVDFSHPDLPAHDWSTRPFWYVWGNTALLFPAEARFSLERLRNSKADVDDLEPVYVRPGDRVTISAVVPVIEDSTFEDPHDCQVRNAYLRVTRATGEVVDLDEPLMFTGTRRLANTAYREQFERFTRRIAHVRGIKDIAALDPHEPQLARDLRAADVPFSNWPIEAFDYVTDLSEIDESLAAAQRVQDALQKSPRDSKRGFELERIVNDALMAGYWLARAEASKPRRAASAIERNRKGATAARVRTDWRALAEAMWSKNPTWSINRVAMAVMKGSDDKSSVIRALRPFCPTTSDSYDEVQATLRRQAERRGGSPPDGQ